MGKDLGFKLSTLRSQWRTKQENEMLSFVFLNGYSASFLKVF